MTAVQEIQAAINELTELRDSATPGQRGFSADWFDGSRQSLVAVEHGIDGDFRSAGRIATFDGPHLARAREDGMLIVTLHRTIDAQIALLRNVIATLLGIPPHLYNEAELAEAYAEDIALARAINGVTP